MKRRTRLLGYDALWDYALRALGARAQSASELRGKLLRRAQRAADADAVVARLKQAGYLDDRRFSESYAAARLENQGFGRNRVLRDLSQRRVARRTAEKVVESAFQGVDEMELIEKFLSRKYRNTSLAAHLADPRNLASAYRKLRRAGFTVGNSIRALKRYARQAEELEGMEEETDDASRE